MKAGIIGGAGYTAGELIRLLLNHPEIDIEFVHSQSNAGNPLTAIHTGLIGDTDLLFTDSCPLESIDALFLCAGHGASTTFWQEHKRPESLMVIDLAQDFRDETGGYVYGLPEINRKRIAATKLLANPGCFATAIQLSLLPLAASNAITAPVQVTGITGSTGAGVKPSATTHFSWRTDNISVYKPFTHQHLAEITRTLSSLQTSEPVNIDFVPMRGDFARGIFTATWLTTKLTQAQAQKIFNDFYADEPFTHVSATPVDLKQVINTNKAIISLQKIGDKLLVTTAIDNLLKGASGQALQNLNIMAGMPETLGLKLKPSAF